MGLGMDSELPRVGNGASPQHSLQLFDCSDSAADVVSGFIAEGIHAGDVVLAVMRRETWESTARRLRERGLDPAVAQADGGLTVLDATATLDTFLVNGRIDQKLFEDSVGTLVWALGSTDRRLRIYGEMVDVLASAGDFRAALQLEARWNGLGAETPFHLLCGYSAENFGNPKASESLRMTCLAHSHIRTNPRDPLATFLLESASSGPGAS
jgi:MEDS: MEthanogen/methylotroph, DcmR Sensory domain